MKEFISRNRNFIVASVVVLVLVAMMSFTARERERISTLERALAEATLPLVRGLSQFGSGVGNWAVAIAESGHLRSENEQLRDQLGRVTALEVQLRELAAENERLQAMLDFKASSSYDLVAARVIGRSPDNWYQAVTIDKGEADGIARNMPVLTSRGLVGRIFKTTAHSATVMLLFDPDSGVGAMVQRTREAGVVDGQLGSPYLRMKFFSRDAQAAPGDMVITSGLGSQFPAGIVIGEVTKVEQGQYGLVRYADIRPAPDYGKLTEVLVLKAAAPTPTK